MSASAAADEEGRKLFLGGLSFDANEDDLKEDFGKFGEIEDLQLPYDPSGKHKGFGFITQDGEYGKDARSDIFVHHSDLQSFSLAPGQRLSFRIARHGGDGRVKATDVQGVRGGVSSYGDEEEIDALFDELFSDVAPAQRDEELF